MEEKARLTMNVCMYTGRSALYIVSLVPCKWYTLACIRNTHECVCTGTTLRTRKLNGCLVVAGSLDVVSGENECALCNVLCAIFLV